MSDRRARYSSNNQNWSFYHPIIGDNWTHLVEQECWQYTQSDNEVQQEEGLEDEVPQQSKISQKLVTLGIGLTVLLGGMAILIQIPNIPQTDLSLTENNLDK